MTSVCTEVWRDISRRGHQCRKTWSKDLSTLFRATSFCRTCRRLEPALDALTKGLCCQILVCCRGKLVYTLLFHTRDSKHTVETNAKACRQRKIPKLPIWFMKVGKSGDVGSFVSQCNTGVLCSHHGLIESLYEQKPCSYSLKCKNKYDIYGTFL